MLNENLSKYKANASMAAKRMEAYWNRDMLDRPIMLAAIPKENAVLNPPEGYYGRCFGNMDEILEAAMHNCAQMEYLGESFPNYWTSLGTHEIAQFCGFDVVWPEDKNTNWCKHSEQELKTLLPLVIKEDNYFWKRSIEIYKKCKAAFQGSIIPVSYDFHSNMDLLLSVRGDANLCMDLYDCPEMVKKGLQDACSIFEKMWKTYVTYTSAEQYGYHGELYSEKPTTTLASDFAALIGTEMFNEFILPTLSYESEIIGERAVFHWDGPDAIKHFDSLMSIRNLHTFSYVPSPFTYHYQFLELYQKVQEKGKGVIFAGNFEEIKAAAKVLKPNLTVYFPKISSVKEFEEIEEWMIKNT